MQIVCLASGGVDSSLMMYLLQERGHNLYPFFVDYGQLSREKEWDSCKMVCNHLNLKPTKIDIPEIGKIVPSGITDSRLDIHKDAFLPNRNLLLLTLASSFGFQKSVYIVAIGLLSKSIFADQTTTFIKSTQKVLSTSLDTDIRIMTPMISLSKLDVLRIGLKHGFPFEMTYYCHSGKKKPCEKCISCKEMTSALQYINM